MILFLKDKYYWYKTHKNLHSFLFKFPEKKILMYGYPKSGNTWLRFLIYNYFSLLKNNSLNNTITYDTLNRLQNNVLDRGNTFIPDSDFPLLYRTHKSYFRSYDLFDYKIFIHRNPMDTLISAYHFYKNRDMPFSDEKKSVRRDMQDINFYVRYKLDSWIKFYYISIKHSDFAINYSHLKSNPSFLLSSLIDDIGWVKNDILINRSVFLSSFDNIKKMGRENKQIYGNGPKDGSFIGEFTRSGIEGQFKNDLDKDTILFVLNKFPEFKNVYPGIL